MARGVSRRVHNLNPPQALAAGYMFVHAAGTVARDVEVVGDLKVVGHDRILRPPGHLLRRPLAGDDVGLPGMAVDGGAAEAFERGQPAQM